MSSTSMKQLQWNDAHFCGLRSQTNIYSLTKITSNKGVTKVLAASLDGHIASVEYQNSFNRLLPITKESALFSSFSSIHVIREDACEDGRSGTNTSFERAGEPQVVSIDVIHTNDHQNIALAVTYLMVHVAIDDDKTPQAYMNIYLLPVGDKDKSYSNVIDEISQSLPQHLGLEFTPLKLTHHKAYLESGQWDTCFLLSGNDQKVHVYRQDPQSELFQEDQNGGDLFPELKNVNGCVTEMELIQQDDTCRLSCFGTSSGFITLFQVNVVERQILNIWTRDFDSAITSIHFFTQHTNAKCPDFIDVPENKGNAEGVQPTQEPMNLLVTSTLDPSAVFLNILSKGLTKCLTLPCSNALDTVLCSCVMDTDFDGENEVLIGTYGQDLIAYKLAYKKPQLMTSTPLQSPAPFQNTEPNTVSQDGDKSGKTDQTLVQDKDVRRRHKSVTALQQSSSSLKTDMHDRHKSDEVTLLEDHFKEVPTARHFRSQENLASPSSKSISFAMPDQSASDCSVPYSVSDLGEYPSYRLIWTRHFCDPVMGLACDDVMGDGMLDLIVLSLKGLHILQPDLQEVSQLVLERLRQLADPSSDADDDYHQLQTEVLHDEH